MKLKKFKKGVTSLLTACLVSSIVTITALAASESINGGGATWYGGEDSEGILFSKVWDNKADGIVYDCLVWVQDDKGTRSEIAGTTNAVGEPGEVKVTRAATHSNPFVAEKTGYRYANAVAAR